jgi:hypothetical protein
MVYTPMRLCFVAPAIFIFIFTACSSGNRPITDLDKVGPHLARQKGSESKPAKLRMSIPLGDMDQLWWAGELDAESGWRQLLVRIAEADKFVDLDLSVCDMNGTSFNPYVQDASGEGKIVSLILPDMAESTVSSFMHFSALKTVYGSGLKTVGDFAFKDNTNLVSARFPGVTQINYQAFYGCTNLVSVEMSSAARIRRSAFTDCTLVSFTLSGDPGLLSTIEDGKALVLYDSDLITFPSASGSITLPVEITRLVEGAFYGCTALQSITLPGVTDISQESFGRCTSLQNINLPAIKKIGNFAFAHTGNTALFITMGPNAPEVSIFSLFYEVTSPKNVTIKVPAGATGYDEIWQKTLRSGKGNINLVIDYE